jgi:TfoX/Sxy family transcriptional regulator of competence genes
MAHDPELAERLHEVLAAQPDLTHKKMFGGHGFLLGGHLAVSASGLGGLLLRVDPAQAESLLNEPLVRRFEMRGRPMKGWLRIDPAAVRTDAELRRWVQLGVDYVRTLD